MDFCNKKIFTILLNSIKGVINIDTKAFHKISYGLYVIGSALDGKYNGQIANTVFQISSDPATIAISINKKNLTNQFIKDGRFFSVSVLAKDTPLSFIGNFGFKSGRDVDKFENVSFKLALNGTPVPTENIVSFLEAEVINILEVETHTIFIGRVTNAEVLSNAEPMTYSYYHLVKKGSVPTTAPLTASQEEEKNNVSNKSEEEKMNKYECSVCGYVYDPVVGDPDSGVAPGTAFESIPEGWVCPICGAEKGQFQPVE